MANPKKQVFISYFHDDTDAVRRLVDDLEQAGETVWWDKAIKGGQDWVLEIRKALNESYAVVICFSETGVARPESGVYSELLRASTAFQNYAPGSIYLIPVRLSACEIPAVMIDGYRMLDQLQHVDLFPERKRQEGLDRLLEAIRFSPQHP